MYPSEKDPYYGTFVESFYNSLKNHAPYSSEKIVIKGRSKNKFKKFGGYLWFYGRIVHRLLFNNYDLVYVHTVTFPIIPIKIVSLFKKIPLVFNVHGSDVLVKSRLASILKKLARPIVEQSKLLVCPSESFKRICIAEFPNITNSQIFISPSGGINKRFFCKPKSNFSETLHIGYVSRIDHEKGWRVFVDAVKILINENYKIKATIVGRGSEKTDLKESIAGYRDKIEYLGPKTQEELPQIYNSFDCFIFPTLAFESLGLVGIEAMASGTPVIASNIGGPSEYINEGVNGFKFMPGDTKDLVNKIKYFYNLSTSRKIEMSNNCINCAKDYESSQVSNMLINKLKTIINIDSHDYKDPQFD